MNLARRIASGVWPVPEPALADEGRRGEHVVARIRLLLVAALAVVPLASVARDPSEPGAWVGVASIAAVLVVSAAIVRFTARASTFAGLGFVTGALDVTAVSLFHLFVVLAGDAGMAFNSRVTFALYLLALTATGLRYDGRVCTSAGLLAIVQWLGLVAWAQASGWAERAQQAGRLYGDTDLGGQVEEIVILMLGTALAGIIVSRARALRLSAIRDGLTGLHNRAYLEERLADELERARRHDRPIAVAVLDIDHFKRVNDTWGHPAGDRALRAVAACLRDGLRRSDLVARYGGEEFVVALPETPLDEACAKLDALRRSVAALAATPPAAKPGAVTISAGVAAFPDDADSPEQLVALADRRLLAAKQAGRNRVDAGAAAAPAQQPAQSRT